MDQLKTMSNAPAALFVKRAVEGRDGLKLSNRLLNGTYQYQTIGDAVKTFEIECYTNEALHKSLIDYEWQGIQIKLIKGGRYYIGLIQDPPETQVYLSSEPITYLERLTLTVDSEGAVT